MVSRDDENRVPVSSTLPESLVEALDEAVLDAPDYLNLSRSELISYAAENGLEHASDDVLDLIPDEHLARYQAKRSHERVKAKHYIVDMLGGWRGRVRSFLNKRLAGEEPYHPGFIEVLAEGYLEDAEDLHGLVGRSPYDFEDDEQWLEEKLDQYEDAYRAKQMVPDSRPFEGVDDAVSLGSDLESLRGRLGGLVADLGTRAESEAYDPDAIVRALAQDYAVSEEAVETVLDVLLPDDVDPRAALKSLDEQDVTDVVPERALEDLSGPSALDAERIEDERVSGSGRDFEAETISFDVDELPGEDPSIDDEEVERIVAEQIRGDGGTADD
jgi:hypothetical protein